MKYLGVDYGKKKIGLAVSEGEVASPLKILEVNGLEEAFEKVSRVVGEEGIETMVVGKPESGEVVKMVENFVKKMVGRGVEIVIVPETLSSHSARAQMRIIGSSKKQKLREDSHSAVIILQDYLDRIVDKSG